LATKQTFFRKINGYKKLQGLENKIKEQLVQIKNGNPTLNLVKPCRVNDGISVLTEQEIVAYKDLFTKQIKDKKITFFIPASGSGSRMFEFLFDFIENTNFNTPQTIEWIEQFLNNIKSFSFYNKLPQYFKDNIQKGDVDIKSLIKFILFEEGLNFGALPKGLIPFHLYDKFIINPFQEQILQGTEIANEKTEFHFTINPTFEKQINHSIKILKEITGIDFSYSFSQQHKNTHSIAFTTQNKIALDHDGLQILRPAGHGALIDNLNQIDADLIFIKNIDNIQHFDKANTAFDTKKALGGLILDFQNKVFNLLHQLDANSNWQTEAQSINKKFGLKISPSNIQNKKWVKHYFNRPIRICGMVKNQGQAGGGPFWVKDDNDEMTIQIIEKSQINANQISILLHATHFNPVDIVCGVKDYKNQKFNLQDFVNPKLYFIVEKNEKGQAIKYVEKPGLWNGGMYNWLTVFYEIDSACFSPVKTVLDLLKPLHIQD